MTWLRYILAGSLIATSIGLVGWLLFLLPTDSPGSPARGGTSASALPPLRLGLIPERDIFGQRQRHRILADYLAEHLGRPVELATFSTYQGVLQDFEQGTVDAAFLGSMITVLVHERHGARAIMKPEYADGVSHYRGVIFVREDSPLRSLTELTDGCLAMVRATMAGHLFPMAYLDDLGLLDDRGQGSMRFCWAGSHDEVIATVADGRATAGAAKDLRIEAFERANPSVRFRRLAVSDTVPENALIVADTVDDALAGALADALLNLEHRPGGDAVLAAFGVERFVPCDIADYQQVYHLMDQLRDHWPELGIDGSAPEASATAPPPATSPDL